MDLCVAVYRLAQSFPREETFGLAQQLRRAAVSVPSNIAEGYGRLSREQYRHFLGIAQGSNLELQTQLEIASRLGFACQQEIEAAAGLSAEVGKILTVMLRKL